MSTPFSKFLQRYRVLAGFVAAAIFIVYCRPTLPTLAVGATVASIGVLLRAWALGHLRKERHLDTSGPYAYTRNPLYFGTFIIAIGFGIASGVWWLFLLLFAFMLSIYFPVMNVEAEELESWLGDEYREYAQNVPLVFPRLTAWKISDRKFDFQLYLKHREYHAAVGLTVAVVLLAIKAYLFN
jgi:protein-S-isoprenylcysteine O-methyltransferase Ste14